MEIALKSTGAGIGDICALADGEAMVIVDAETVEVITRSYVCLNRHAAAGEAIYGVSTGLGAAVDTRVAPAEGTSQHRIPEARAVGVGRFASRREVRAIMAARMARLCRGYAGASPQIVSALRDMLNHAIHPQVPLTGSIGEADLAPLAHIAMVLTGGGVATLEDGRTVSGKEAFLAAGLELPRFGLKDGLALVSSNAASVALACLSVPDIERALDAHVGAVTLSFEGFRASLNPIDPSASRLRPAPLQTEVAEGMRRLLAGSELFHEGAARRLQDPISLRSVASVMGTAFHALAAAREAVELELHSSDDNPAVIADEDRVLPNGNFDPTHMALAFDTLGLMLARVSAMAAERIMKLMSPGFSDLPRFLAPPEPGSNGFATLQKTVSALTAEIAHLAMPMPFTLVPVADRVEDYASMAMPVIEKTARLAERFRWLTAIELIVAAQAVEMRGGVRIGDGCRALLESVRASVAPLDSDRSVSADILALAEKIEKGLLMPSLSGLLKIA